MSITVDDVIDALAAFLEPFCPNVPIIRAQVNRVPMPTPACIVLTELLQVAIEVPSLVFDDPLQQSNVKSPTRIDVQVDFYGPDAGDQCMAIAGVLRTVYSPSQFPDGIKPLYASDGVQSPLITGEQQWASRWMLTVSLQYNPELVLPAQSANVLAPNIIQAIDL